MILENYTFNTNKYFPWQFFHFSWWCFFGIFMMKVSLIACVSRNNFR